MPVIQFKSSAKPSTFGYPAPLEEKKKEDKEKVATAILSITNKQKKKVMHNLLELFSETCPENSTISHFIEIRLLCIKPTLLTASCSIYPKKEIIAANISLVKYSIFFQSIYEGFAK